MEDFRYLVMILNLIDVTN